MRNLLLTLAVLGFGGWALAAEAPDFPPGVFTDGGHYSLKDLEGKVVVLFFYEQDCPRCRGKIPDRNKVVESYAGKPIRFFAIAASDSLQEAKAYAASTGLEMPVFADSLGVMEARYGTKISLQNIWQFRIIGPDGMIKGSSMEPKDIDAALAKAKWKYKDGGYDAKLEPAVELIEWGQYAEGLRAIKPLLRNSKKEVADSAKKLYEAVKAEGAAWLADADGKAGTDPVAAYDLYAKVADDFVGEDIAKKASEAMKKLAAKPELKDELAARRMWEQLAAGMAKARPQQKADVGAFAASIAKKYPKTPTGEKAGKLATELGG